MPEAPRREDIPDYVDGGDILFELRLFEYEFAVWRLATNGDLGWLRKLRVMVADVTKMAIIAIPIVTAVIIALMAR